MEKKLYMVKNNVLVAVMEVGFYTLAAPAGTRTIIADEHEFAALKAKEGINTTEYDKENSDGIEDINFEEIPA